MSEHRRRLEALRTAMDEQGVDAAVISDEANVLYLTGYVTYSYTMRARPLVLLIEADRATAIVASAEAARFAVDAPHYEVIAYSAATSRAVTRGVNELDFGLTVTAVLGHRLRRVRRMGAELTLPAIPELPHPYLETLHLSIIDIAPALRALRRRKGPMELDALRRAATTLGTTFDYFAEQARPGMTEKQLAAALRGAAAKAGADQLRYFLIVAGSQHEIAGTPTDRTWSPGELLFVDAGLTVDGYWADFCRHYAAETVSTKQANAYAQLVQASLAARESAISGAHIGGVATSIHAELPNGGDGLQIGRVGHGIGLNLTEPPSVSADDPAILEPDMTLCLEPIGTFPGLGFLIAEETVALTDGSPILLSPAFPNELPVLTASPSPATVG